MNEAFPLKKSRLYWNLFPKNLSSAYPISKFLALWVLQRLKQSRVHFCLDKKLKNL